MMNLFSSFDPSSSLNYSLNWTSSTLIIMIPTTYWMIPSRINMVWNKMLNYINNSFKSIIQNKNFKQMILLPISLFIMIATMNIYSLFPYTFCSTSHLTVNLSITLPMWMSMMIYSWLNKTTHMLAHMTTPNTPSLILHFMVCIESISYLIRPSTLSIRLTANMIAGHMTLTLLENSSINSNKTWASLILISQMILLMLESMVSIIQAYVFSTLMTLYYKEMS